jgi:hypothetical protein
MPTGEGIEGQPRTGHLSYPGQRNPTQKTGRADGTEGGQHKTGHLEGPGNGGISRGGGGEPVKETQGKTGFEQKTARATKDKGGHGIDNISSETIKEI